MKKFIGSLVATAVLLLGGAAPGYASGGYGGHHGLGGHHGGYGGHHGFGGHHGRFGRHFGSGAFGDRYRYSEPPSSYWYYCESAQAYHPYVQECPGGWRTVTPPTTAPGQ